MFSAWKVFIITVYCPKRFEMVKCSLYEKNNSSKSVYYEKSIYHLKSNYFKTYLFMNSVYFVKSICYIHMFYYTSIFCKA